MLMNRKKWRDSILFDPKLEKKSNIRELFHNDFFGSSIFRSYKLQKIWPGL